MSSALEVVELVTQNGLSATSLVVSITAWRRQNKHEPSPVASGPDRDELRPPSAINRGVSFAARMTGDSQRYQEEWAAELHDLPRRPRHIRTMYLLRISARAIPIGAIAWSTKRRKA
ncbi:hypothetical protein [Streptomyces sp. NPDC056463]|uniref:effector-associated constant component EACC1 n=1 Tax=unclassified Streptomyces TaxID=2593676 RepID=UPI0036B235B8